MEGYTSYILDSHNEKFCLSYFQVGTRQTVHIHPSSALFGPLPHCVLFTELVQTGRCYMRDLSVIDPNWLEDVNPAYAKLHPLRKLD